MKKLTRTMLPALTPPLALTLSLAACSSPHTDLAYAEPDGSAEEQAQFYIERIEQIDDAGDVDDVELGDCL